TSLTSFLKDCDGTHIKALLINIFLKFWPKLLKSTPPFINDLLTPRIKGLGSISPKESLEYFKNLDKHMRQLCWDDPNEDSESEKAITLAFCPKKREDRKRWIETYLNGGLEAMMLMIRSAKALRFVRPLLMETAGFSSSDRNLSYRERLSSGIVGIKKDDAVVLFQTMIESRPLPTVIDFNRLFSAVARTKQHDLVLALCKQLELHMTTTR
ncbi:hypothetical protein F2Q70_00041093, partial [Brassica cretica]